MRLKDITLGFWVPLALGGASLIFSLSLPALGVSLPSWATYAALVIGASLIVLAGYSAFRAARMAVSPENALGSGGVGGAARVSGNQSAAIGGEGGRGEDSAGGRGGDADVTGNQSVAVGGKGGDAARRRDLD